MIREVSPLAGQTVTTKQTAAQIGSREIVIEDWWQNVYGGSWKTANGNPAALVYAARTAGNTPFDDEVLYGKIGGLGYLVHVNELETAGATA